jgi:hypothetical protein
LYSLGGDFGSLQLDYPTLQETFFGLPLMVAVVVIAVVFWRDTAARATAVVALAAGILSLGYRLRYNGAEHYIADFGPWRILGRLPLLESVIPTRFGLAMAPPIGFLLALAVKHIRAYEGPDRYRRIRVIGYAGIAAVLVPLAPTPLAVVGRPPTPSFISSGEWRSHVRPGRTLISLPVSNQVLNMSRAAGQNLDYPFVSGYFLGPDPDSPRGTAMFGTRPRPTEKIWTAVYNDHGMPAVTAADRDRARQDFRYWHAGVIILPPQPRATAIREVTTELVGFPPIRSGGVWVWDLP